jgi:hypothetical protein
MVMRKITRIALWSTPLLLAGAAALAQEPMPANPSVDDKDMMTKCMEQTDPALNKDDAIRACKEKWKQGVKVGEPKKPKKPKPKPNEDTPGKT